MSELRPSATDVQVGGEHYRNMKIQPIEFALANQYDAAAAAILKYVARHRTKNGREDVEKAIRYVHLRQQLAPGSLLVRALIWLRAYDRVGNWRRNNGWTIRMADFIQINEIHHADADVLLDLEAWLWGDTQQSRLELLESLNLLLRAYQ